MGYYVYNEEKFLFKLDILKKKFPLDDSIVQYIIDSARVHRQDWNDNSRKIADDIRYSHSYQHTKLIEYTANLSNEDWATFMLFIDEFLFEVHIWCDMFEAANQEQKNAYFEVC